MRISFCLSGFAVFAFLFVSISPVQAQFTDEFEGTYTFQTAPKIFSGDVAPGWTAYDGDWSGNGAYAEITGATGSGQRISTTYGEGFVIKTFSVTPGNYVRPRIWIKTASNDGASQADGWVEYGYDPTGQTSDPNAGTTRWHKDADDAPKNNLDENYNTWTEYSMPDIKVQQSVGGTVSVWLKAGSVTGTGIRADFDNLTVEESPVPPGGPTPEDFPDDFNGTYSTGGVAPGWYKAALPGGVSLNWAEATGRTGEAQRMYTPDAIIGVTKLFNAPSLTNVHLSIWAQTASSDGGSAFDPEDGDILFGYDTTGQVLDMGAGTIVWDDSIDQAGAIPFGTWTQFEGPTFFLSSGQDTVSVWLRVEGGFSSPGARADFDDLELVVEGAISGASDWEIYR